MLYNTQKVKIYHYNCNCFFTKKSSIENVLILMADIDVDIEIKTQLN